MIKVKSRKSMKNLRHRRVRNKVAGNSQTPRLSVFKSLSHIYAQVIDDTTQSTLVSCSTLTPKISELIKKDKINKVDASKLVGQEIGDRCKEKGINTIKFDRGGFPYTGRVKSLAEAVREKGIKF
ncbi:MAG: 50S ribosomal protein L18 [Candidatus Dadabacteria bacterium]|nr:50S ribosomal protein L18 [Candidatus Dadabacteria bacterium]NIV40891.1 50S ribosomal protein L18 [Candidatus Dadabacteria bacterium]NIX16141.1 50S ribosomal protein L18 [Candidatus Dadabacteria bacterium]